MIGQSEFGAYLLHSSLASVRFWYAFYQPQQTVQEYWAQSTCFDFSSSNLTLQRHKLSTSGVALTSTLISHWKYFVLISSVLWKLCCLYWNMLTEYRMKSSTIFSCTKGWWTETYLVPAWKLYVVFERIIQPWLLMCTTMGLINGWPIVFSNSDKNPFPLTCVLKNYHISSFYRWWNINDIFNWVTSTFPSTRNLS
jgi:hypothetical protein